MYTLDLDYLKKDFCKNGYDLDAVSEQEPACEAGKGVKIIVPVTADQTVTER